VLNLLSVRSIYGDEHDYIYNPFFANLTLNESLVLKHKVRPDEQYVFRGAKHVAAEVIIPFAKTDLKLGGRILFVGQNQAG